MGALNSVYKTTIIPDRVAYQTRTELHIKLGKEVETRNVIKIQI